MYCKEKVIITYKTGFKYEIISPLCNLSRFICIKRCSQISKTFANHTEKIITKTHMRIKKMKPKITRHNTTHGTYRGGGILNARKNKSIF